MKEKTNEKIIEERLIKEVEQMKKKCKDCEYFHDGSCSDFNGEKECWGSLNW